MRLRLVHVLPKCEFSKLLDSLNNELNFEVLKGKAERLGRDIPGVEIAHIFCKDELIKIAPEIITLVGKSFHFTSNLSLKICRICLFQSEMQRFTMNFFVNESRRPRQPGSAENYDDMMEFIIDVSLRLSWLNCHEYFTN